MSLAILWLYGSAPCCEWQPHLKRFAHAGREQRSMKYKRQNKTSKSAKYPAEEGKTGEKQLNAVFVESSVS